jgi:hypothetical protein
MGLIKSVGDEEGSRGRCLDVSNEERPGNVCQALVGVGQVGMPVIAMIDT